ncbi:hypothetical protein V5F55_20350 [Xanthobacter sp. V3C-4]|uniref:hypothetical protein n=1 Tax=Xanthobacter autotrophicus (strain ATCC BAA-1158 / Py2) TaxID=78245 RepID=UPI00372921BC
MTPDSPESLGGRYAGIHLPADLARWCGILQTWPITDAPQPPSGFAERLQQFDAAASRLSLLPADLLCPVLADDLRLALGLEFPKPAERWRAVAVSALEGAWRIAEAQEKEAADFVALSRVLHDLGRFQEAPWHDAMEIRQRLVGLDDVNGEDHRSDVASALERLTSLRDDLERLALAKRPGGRPDHPRTFFAARLAESVAIGTGSAPQLFGRAGPWRGLLHAAETLAGFPMAPSGQGMDDLMRRVAELPLWPARIDDLVHLHAVATTVPKMWRIADLPSAGLEILAL